MRNSNSVRLTQLPFFVKQEHDSLERLLENAEAQIVNCEKMLPFELVTASMNEIRSCLISSRNYAETFPSEFLYAAYNWKSQVLKAFGYAVPAIMLTIPQYTHAEEPLPSEWILRTFSKENTYIFITYVPPPHIDDVSSWCFTAHEIGHGALSAQRSFSYAILSILNEYESEILEQKGAFAKILDADADVVDIKDAREMVVNYLSEVASDLIATSLCSEAYLYSFKEEYGLQKKWSKSHPPLTLRIKIILDIFEDNGWMPANKLRDKTLKDSATGHDHAGLSQLLLQMAERLLDFRLNGTTFREALAELSQMYCAKLSVQAWSLLNKIVPQSIAGLMDDEEANYGVLDEAVGRLIMTGQFRSYFEVIACASLLRSAFGKGAQLDKSIMDTTHRAFIKRIYEKARGSNR